jgi:hypothetical protein
MTDNYDTPLPQSPAPQSPAPSNKRDRSDAKLEQYNKERAEQRAKRRKNKQLMRFRSDETVADQLVSDYPVPDQGLRFCAKCKDYTNIDIVKVVGIPFEMWRKNLPVDSLLRKHYKNYPPPCQIVKVVHLVDHGAGAESNQHNTMGSQHSMLGSQHNALGSRVQSTESDQLSLGSQHSMLGSRVQSAESDQHNMLGSRVQSAESDQHNMLGSRVQSAESDQLSLGSCVQSKATVSPTIITIFEQHYFFEVTFDPPPEEGEGKMFVIAGNLTCPKCTAPWSQITYTFSSKKWFDLTESATHCGY